MYTYSKITPTFLRYILWRKIPYDVFIVFSFLRLRSWLESVDYL